MFGIERSVLRLVFPREKVILFVVFGFISNLSGFRCTVRSACQKASHNSPRWLSLGKGQRCIDFEQVVPDRIPIDQMTTVSLTIRTLPELPYGNTTQTKKNQTHNF